jgi:hypothetical protein
MTSPLDNTSCVRAFAGTAFASSPGLDYDDYFPSSTRSTTMASTEFPRTDTFAKSEGRVARAIEEQTSKLPSDTFLWLAVSAMATSATLQLMGNKHVSLFVGQWAPSFLLFGIYNKLVKQLGSDRTENAV